MTIPQGLISFEDIITPAQEQELLRVIYENDWDTSLSRRVQHYGYRYNYKFGTTLELNPVKPIPEWAQSLFEKIAIISGINIDVKLQLIVNEYTVGQGIRAHIDDPKQFGDWVMTISLGSTCQMEFEKKQINEKYSIILPTRSAYVLTGESRFNWTHSIPMRKSDMIQDKRVKRDTRVSITFRSMK